MLHLMDDQERKRFHIYKLVYMPLDQILTEVYCE